MFRVVQQVEGLDTAAGAEIQGPGHMPTGGDLHQGGGRLPDPQHMVVAEDAGALVRGQVTGHPQIRPAAADGAFPREPGPAVWPQVHPRPHLARLGQLHQAQFQQALHAGAGEGCVDGLGLLRFRQQPEPDDGGERRRRRLPAEGASGDNQCGDQLVPAQGGMGGGAQQRCHPIDGVADAAQVRPERIEQARQITAGCVGDVAGEKVR